jgi:hypothetical protein
VRTLVDLRACPVSGGEAGQRGSHAHDYIRRAWPIHSRACDRPLPADAPSSGPHHRRTADHSHDPSCSDDLGARALRRIPPDAVVPPRRPPRPLHLALSPLRLLPRASRSLRSLLMEQSSTPSDVTAAATLGRGGEPIVHQGCRGLVTTLRLCAAQGYSPEE